jgi:5-methylcytosine-specific restriction endonuclease McrA
MARCAYCGRDLLVDFDIYMSAHLDHFVPTTKGGDDSDQNMVLACSVCNILKGNFDPRSTAAESGSRQDLLHAARVHIAKRRVEKIEDYFSYLKKYNAA